MTPPRKTIQPNISGEGAGGAAPSVTHTSAVSGDGGPVKWPSNWIEPCMEIY